MLREDNTPAKKDGRRDPCKHETGFMKDVLENLNDAMNMKILDQETARMVKRLVIMRISTKHINLWMRQLDMKRVEICKLAELMGCEDVKEEIQKEKSLERWAKRTNNHFTKNVKRMLFQDIDNMVWNDDEGSISEWCKRNKVYDEITEMEIEEIWKRKDMDNDEPVRLNGKYVWETAKRVCEFINTHEDLVQITTFEEYRVVMRKIMRVIREAHNTERKRRQTSRKEKSEMTRTRIQRAKSLICEIKRGMKMQDIAMKLEEIFGKGSSQELEKETSREKIIERIEEISRREAQFDEWEKMRQEAKKRQREDKRLNLFWRRNKAFPKKFGSEEESPEAEETLMFWRSINNKEASEGWREDRSIREVFTEVRMLLRKRRGCRWFEFTEAEFEEVLRCTAPWKACGVDSVYSFPIKKCPPIRKAVFELVKKVVEWKVNDRWDDENNWLLEGRTVLIFKGETGKTLLTTGPSPVFLRSRR